MRAAVSVQDSATTEGILSVRLTAGAKVQIFCFRNGLASLLEFMT